MEESEKKDETKVAKSLEKEIIEKTKKSIKEIIDDDISPENLSNLDKLVDIYKDIKEVESMNYGNYNGYGNYGNYSGNYNGYGEYGRGSYGRDSYGREQYGESPYGRRGRDSRYRGDEYMGRMNEEYGRYMESRSYGDAEESNKSFHYMVKALEDFIKVLEEEAETQEQKMQLKQAIQKSMM